MHTEKYKLKIYLLLCLLTSSNFIYAATTTSTSFIASPSAQQTRSAPLPINPGSANFGSSGPKLQGGSPQVPTITNLNEAPPIPPPTAADLAPSANDIMVPSEVSAPTTTVTTVTKTGTPSMIIVPDNESLGGVHSFSESEETMLNAAPPGPPPSQDEQDAFRLMMKQITPLTAKQIIRLHQLIDDSQRAASIPANVPPKPVSTTLIMNLAPGATPPAIRLAKGYVSSLVFVDSTGAPWPIASYEIGDPKTSNIQWDGKSNILLIQASTPYGVSDIVISLVGLMTPLTLELVSGQRVVDYRTDIHVSGIGPNTKVIPTGTNLPNSANQLLLGVLDGIAPDGSKPLHIHGGDCQAWLLGDKMYLRTRLTLLSPGWVGRMVSPDGMIAYEVQRSSSILVSQYGQPIELRVEGF